MSADTSPENSDVLGISSIRPRQSQELPHRFAQRVSTIDAVKAVMSVRTHDGTRIWTILDRDPENRNLRDSIYDIEGEVLAEFRNVNVDFRLINLSEYPNPGTIQLPSHKVIYQREQADCAEN